MKKYMLFILAMLAGIYIFAQVEQHEVSVVEIEVPVRVTDSGEFIENLTIEDFEVYENGQMQKIKSLYLIKDTNLEREESPSWTTPKTARQFFMLFQLQEHNPRLNEAIAYFFNEVLKPEDSLTIMTPMKRYNLSSQALQTKPKETLAQEMQNLIRKDTLLGSGDYNSLMRDLKRMVRSLSSTSPMSGLESDSTSSQFGVEFLLPRYKDTLQKMEDLRVVDEKKILTFAAQLKRTPGQKLVFFFYQREFRPEIEPRIINQMMSLYQDQSNIMDMVQDLFQMYSRSNTLHSDLIRQAFADSAILFNFIFMNKEPENVVGIRMNEQSEDVFSIFSQVAEATGGIVDNSQNPITGFKNAVNASQTYYVLVYSPTNYQQDGQFKNIKVMLKDKDYKISHREGYFAN